MMVQPNLGLVQEDQMGIDPALYEQQAQGMAAANQLRSMQSSPQMALALRQAETEMPQMMGGQGYASAAPTIFNVLGTLAQRNKGRKELEQMQRQSDALRGQMQSGRMAELQAQDARSQLAFDRNRQLAEEARTAANQRFTGQPQRWVDEHGNGKNFVMTGEGPKDPITKEIVDLEGFRPPERGGKWSRYGQHLLRSKDSTASSQAYERIRAATDLKKQAADFGVEDVKSMNLPAMKLAIDQITPKAWENYVNANQRNFSPRVKKFMTSLNSLSADQRHEIFGASLTGSEQQSAESFVVGGKGLRLGDSLLRLDSLVDAQKQILGGLDDGYGSTLLSHPTVTSYTYEDLDKPSEGNQGSQSGTKASATYVSAGSMSDDELEKEYNKIIEEEKRNERIRNNQTYMSTGYGAGRIR